MCRLFFQCRVRGDRSPAIEDREFWIFISLFFISFKRDERSYRSLLIFQSAATDSHGRPTAIGDRPPWTVWDGYRARRKRNQDLIRAPKLNGLNF